MREDQALASPRDGGTEEITEDERDASISGEERLKQRGLVTLELLEEAPAIQEAVLSSPRGGADTEHELHVRRRTEEALAIRMKRRRHPAGREVAAVREGLDRLPFHHRRALSEEALDEAPGRALRLAEIERRIRGQVNDAAPRQLAMKEGRAVRGIPP